MIDAKGEPLTDPARARTRARCCRSAGRKGYGLALIFGLLAGTLNSAAFGRE